MISSCKTLICYLTYSKNYIKIKHTNVTYTHIYSYIYSHIYTIWIYISNSKTKWTTFISFVLVQMLANSKDKVNHFHFHCFGSDVGKKFPNTSVPIFEGPHKCVIVFKHNWFVNWLEMFNFMEITVVYIALNGSEPLKEWISNSESQTGMIYASKLAFCESEAFSNEKRTVACIKLQDWSFL